MWLRRNLRWGKEIFSILSKNNLIRAKERYLLLQSSVKVGNLNGKRKRESCMRRNVHLWKNQGERRRIGLKLPVKGEMKNEQRKRKVNKVHQFKYNNEKHGCADWLYQNKVERFAFAADWVAVELSYQDFHLNKKTRTNRNRNRNRNRKRKCERAAKWKHKQQP